MTKLLTWKAGSFSGHIGFAGGIELFTIHWHTRDKDPKYFMQSRLLGLDGRSWRSDDLDDLKAMADEQLGIWLIKIGAWPRSDALVPEPNVFADPYNDPPRPIGRDVHIRFGATDDGAFDVEMEDGDLNVSLYDLGGRGIAVLPFSNNSVRIRKVTR